MSTADPAASDDSKRRHDLREEVSNLLLRRLEVVSADTAAMFVHTSSAPLDRDYSGRLADGLIRLLAMVVRDSAIDDRGVLVASLRSAILERSLGIESLFRFAYLAERTALDELALDDRIGATTEAWALVAQLVRRASFDYLASFAARSRPDSRDATTDELTTLYTRAVFDAVVLKETERCGRCGDGLALILFDVDRLGAINDAHGYDVGTRILERLGILMRQYFRRHDWVARHGDDEIAVLLSGADARHAGELAERARLMVEQRLSFVDHRTQVSVAVTVSAAAVNVDGSAGTVVDPERLLVAAEGALQRAKAAGRNRVELVGSVAATPRTLPRNSPSA